MKTAKAAAKKVRTSKPAKIDYFEPGREIIRRMRKQWKKGWFDRLGKNTPVVEMGENGRTAELSVNTLSGDTWIEEKGKCYSVTLHESVKWFREQFSKRWFQDFDFDKPGFYLWLGIVEGCLEEHYKLPRKKSGAPKGKAKR